MGVVLFLLALGVDIKTDIEGKEVKYWDSVEFVKQAWSNRVNWKIVHKMLKNIGAAPDEVTALKDLLQNLLSKSADARLTTNGILQSKWMNDYHLASPKELNDYFNPTPNVASK